MYSFLFVVPYLWSERKVCFCTELREEMDSERPLEIKKKKKIEVVSHFYVVAPYRWS